MITTTDDLHPKATNAFNNALNPLCSPNKYVKLKHLKHVFGWLQGKFHAVSPNVDSSAQKENSRP
jgi:hypothetical protein